MTTFQRWKIAIVTHDFVRMSNDNCSESEIRIMSGRLWNGFANSCNQQHQWWNSLGEKKTLICSPAPIYNRPKLKQDRNCASSTPTDCRKVKISYFLCPGTTLFDRWKLPGSQLENCKGVFLPYCFDTINNFFRAA